MKNKSAFTLIELLVYMAILGFIIVVAGRVFSDSTSMRVRSQNMLKTMEEVGHVANLIQEDMSDMGVKTWGTKEAGSSIVTDNLNNVTSEVYISSTSTPPDNSSFMLFREHDGTRFDSLVFRKAEFGGDGAFMGVREISWAVNEAGELHRRCRTITSGKATSECPEAANMNNTTITGVLIEKNIKKFTLYPSTPGVSNVPSADTIFPPTVDNKSFNLLAVINSPQAKNIDFEYNNTSNPTVAHYARYFAKGSENNEDNYNLVYLVPPNETSAGNCFEVPIKKGETYVIEFNMPFPIGVAATEDALRDSNSTNFIPGKDHIAAGLRYSDGTAIDGISPDVLFYTSYSEEGEYLPRIAEISAKENPSNKRICAALKLSFYSDYASIGKISFSNFKVYKKKDGAYHFAKGEYATETDGSADKLKRKRDVKAFELILEIDNNGEVAGTYSKDSEGMAIRVPNNGE